MCVSVSSGCVSVHQAYIWYLKRPEEGLRSLVTHL